MEKRKQFWKNKKVLITGADGFVGSNLDSALTKMGAKVISFPYDIRKYAKVREVVNTVRPDMVYHLAAQPLTSIGKSSPLSTFEVNIKGTWNVLEACRINTPGKIIIASTAHVYGDNPNLPYKEEYYPQPSRPYETSKASADLLSQSYADTYSLPVEICRMVNLYGPGDKNTSRIFPGIISKLLKGENPEIFDVGIIRDFLYITDAVDAYMKVAEADLPNTKRARVVNFGSGKPLPVIKLASMIIEEYGNNSLKLILKPLPKEREKEIQKQYVSIKKAQKLVGWSPSTSISEGIRKTIKYYKKNSDIIT